MKRLKKIISVCVIFACILTMFTGCSIGETKIYFASNPSRNTIFKIGPMSCKKDELKVYLLNDKNIYAEVLGTNIWNENYDVDVIEESLKDGAVSHLTKIYALNLYARENKIELTEEEKLAVDKASEEYYKSLTKAEKKFTKASKKDIRGMYLRYALAQKVYKMLLANVDEEVSEDEARVIDAYVLFVYDESLAKSISGKLAAGASFERLASTYTKLDSYRVTFGRNTYSKEIEDEVFNLDNGKYVGPIAADEGYYFFHCIDKYNKVESEKNKDSIIVQRKEDAINEVIKTQEEKYYNSYNKKALSKITMGDAGDLNSNSFYTTIENYLSF